MRRNALKDYKDLGQRIKEMEKEKSSLRDEILAEFDTRGVDEFTVGEYKAKRDIVIQERLDIVKVREFLGDKLPEYSVQVESVKITVI